MVFATVTMGAAGGCGDDDGASDDGANGSGGSATGGQDSNAQDTDASGGTSSGGTSSGGANGTGIGSVTLKDIAADAQTFVDADHSNCGINLIVAQGIEPDGTVATPTSTKIAGWSVSFICDGEMVFYNDISSAPDPYETVGPAAPDGATFAIDDCPDSPLIMTDYADAGCTPVTGEVFDSLRVSAFPGGDPNGPTVLLLVGSSTGDWSGSFDATGLLDQTVPCM